ncbi:hypothetical protein RNJ44_02608 [Nakaseomyces bracarensis]|uniref:Uncharacterized protein n=1 Tax=Nakaseomyces bracarensis TaxID=273131 RepID=A0ABR4NZQ9_9SACH
MSQTERSHGSTDQLSQIQAEEPLNNIPTESTSTNEQKTESSPDVVTVFDIASEIEGLLMDVQRQVSDNDAQFQKSISAIENKLKLMQK